jgi:hypothetical protein
MQKKWLNEYGPVVGLMYGSHPTIAVVGAETALEVLRREEFQGRPDSFNARDRAFNKRLGNAFRLFPLSNIYSHVQLFFRYLKKRAVYVNKS